MVAEHAKMIELALNNPFFFTADGVMCEIESFRILPFSRISSILNQGIVPPSQKWLFDVDGV